jgi:hypothetical protein
MRGEVGEAEKQGKTKQEVAKIHAATAVLETERKAEKAAADAKLTNKEIQIGNDLNIARINAKREAEKRDAELNIDVEKKRALMELERLRATTVVQAKIQKESSQQKADAELYAQEKAAEGQKFSEQASAEAAAFRRLRDAEANYAAKEREAEANFLVTKRQAEAEYFRKERDAQAQLIAQQCEAEGLSAMAKAYGDMANVLGGPQGLVSLLIPLPSLMYLELTRICRCSTSCSQREPTSASPTPTPTQSKASRPKSTSGTRAPQAKIPAQTPWHPSVICSRAYHPYSARSTTRRACSRLLGWRRCPRLDRKLWTRRRRED